MQQYWVEERLAGILLMDIKGAFDYVRQKYLLYTMEGMSADADLMR